jgi:hypothetical protein
MSKKKADADLAGISKKKIKTVEVGFIRKGINSFAPSMILKFEIL